MKIKEITIEGMHGKSTCSYQLDDIVYFHGKNGAGKSTILQAIQLALLGYVPGYSKTNQSIIQHATNKTLSLEVVLQDNDKTCIITRTWMNKGKSVSSSVDITEGYDIKSLTEELELPVFNFNDWRNTSANSLKKWFISFLPKEFVEIDWRSSLTEALEGKEMMDTSLLDSILSKIESITDKSGTELVQEVNNLIKSELSFYKSAVTRWENSLSTLIKYDDADANDESAVSAELTECQNLLASLKMYNGIVTKNAANRAAMANLRQEVDSNKINQSAELEKEIAKASAELDKLRNISNQSRIDLQTFTKIIPNTQATMCPYLKHECPDLISKAAEIDKIRAEKLNQYNTMKADCEAAENKTAEADKIYRELQSRYSILLSEINKEEREVERYRILNQSLLEEGECPTDRSEAELEARCHELIGILQKIAANKAYDKAYDDCTKEKMIAEDNVATLKLWSTLTDANHLQSQLASKPFIELASDIDKEIKTLFGDASISAEFNIAEKADSFSFGIKRDNKYIPFDLLSSGEKCIYSLALLVALVKRSSSPLKLIMIDDSLDHLDSDNAAKLFESLKEVEGIQIIMAGVQNCKNKKITREIGG